MINSNTLFISYKKEVGFRVTILLETDNGIQPFSFENPAFINYYPHLANKIKDGKTLYVSSSCGYLGTEQTEGPYAEQKVFVSEYECNNIDLNEIIIKLNQNIKNNKKVLRKLIKVGNRYE